MERPRWATVHTAEGDIMRPIKATDDPTKWEVAVPPNTLSITVDVLPAQHKVVVVPEEDNQGEGWIERLMRRR